MKTLLIFPLTLVATLLSACSSKHGTEPTVLQKQPRQIERNYAELRMRELDEMSLLVQSKIREARDNHAIQPLREAMKLVYSRPDEDGMVTKLIAPIRSELENNDAYESVTESVIDECIDALKEPDNVKVVDQVTYIVMLENILAELKPKAKEPGFSQKMITKIRDSHVEVSKAAQRERKMRMMRSALSPSEIAAKIIPYPED